MENVLLILRKEWLELRQQRTLLFGTAFLPVVITLLNANGLYKARSSDLSAGLSSVSHIPATLAGLTRPELAQVLAGQQFRASLLVLPLLIPTIIAAYSVIGEKTGRTLEPLLATPMRTWELLLGKCLAALLPAIAYTWLAGLAFIVELVALSTSQRVVTAVLTSGWLLTLVLSAPLLALISVAVMVIVSSWVNDPRAAQSISGLLLLPLLVLLAVQIAGVVSLGPLASLISAVSLALIAVLVFWGATRLFRREVILTRGV